MLFVHVCLLRLAISKNVPVHAISSILPHYSAKAVSLAATLPPTMQPLVQAAVLVPSRGWNRGTNFFQQKKQYILPSSLRSWHDFPEKYIVSRAQLGETGLLMQATINNSFNDSSSIIQVGTQSRGSCLLRKPEKAFPEEAGKTKKN